MLKISHLPRIMIRMKRKGKAAVGGRVYQRSVCRYHEARYLTRPDIRDDASIVPYRLLAVLAVNNGFSPAECGRLHPSMHQTAKNNR